MIWTYIILAIAVWFGALMEFYVRYSTSMKGGLEKTRQEYRKALKKIIRLALFTVLKIMATLISHLSKCQIKVAVHQKKFLEILEMNIST